LRIIDFRSRPSTREYLLALEHPLTKSVMRKLGTTPPAPTTLDGWVANFTAKGVERVVFTGRQTEGTEEHDVGNDYVADVAHRFPDNVVGFAGINPLRGMKSVQAVEHTIHHLGLKGVSIDPFGGLIPANDRRLYPIYAKCVELSVPVVITCGPLPFAGPRLVHGDVRAIDDVAVDFPELTIIIDHSGWPWVGETIAIAFRHENVYIDTSLYSHLPGASLFAEAANTIIPDRILFASCFPVVPIETALERIQTLPFKPDALEGVLYRNADRLLRRLGCY
jgi:predicted TIM-barrel fold metal-dependent hydrolase